MLVLLPLAVLQDAADLSAATTPPRLLNGPQVASFYDYPMASLRAGDSGIVSVLLLVNAKGRVTRCGITETSGSVELDQQTCGLLALRARFDPARNSDNIPSIGLFRIAFAWGQGQSFPTTQYAIDLPVAQVPTGYHGATKTQLTFDKTGKLSACEVTTSSGSDEADAIACRYVRDTLLLQGRVEASGGLPAAAIRYATIKLLPPKVRATEPKR